MIRTMTDLVVIEIADLVSATGLPQSTVARRLDVRPETLSRWLAGTQKVQHPTMLKKALQMITLESKGMITDALIGAVAPQEKQALSVKRKATRTASSGLLKLSRKSIRAALDNAMAFSGNPLSKEDRKIIEKALLEEGDSSTKRKRDKKS